MSNTPESRPGQPVETRENVTKLLTDVFPVVQPVVAAATIIAGAAAAQVIANKIGNQGGKDDKK